LDFNSGVVLMEVALYCSTQQAEPHISYDTVNIGYTSGYGPQHHLVKNYLERIWTALHNRHSISDEGVTALSFKVNEESAKQNKMF
jgi:hypothetical protein